MRRCLTAILVVGLVSTFTPRDAAAQSAKDLVAYAALISTPAGALSPIMIAPGTKGTKSFNSFAGRYSHFSPQGGGNGSNTFGASVYHKAGMNAAVSGTVGYLTCDGCDGLFMVGADVHSTLWNSNAKSTDGTSINLQGSVGYGSESGTNALSLAVGVPLAISMTQASKSQLSAYVSPGFGWGRLSASGSSESGALPLVGVGGSWASAAGWGIHASWQKVFIESVSGNTFGVGFSYQMGK